MSSHQSSVPTTSAMTHRIATLIQRSQRTCRTIFMPRRAETMSDPPLEVRKCKHTGASILDLPCEIRLAIYELFDEPLKLERRYRLADCAFPSLMICRDQNKKGNIDATILIRMQQVCRRFFWDVNEFTRGVTVKSFIHSNHIFWLPSDRDFECLSTGQYPNFWRIERVRFTYLGGAVSPIPFNYFNLGLKRASLREITIYHDNQKFLPGNIDWTRQLYNWELLGWALEAGNYPCEDHQREWVEEMRKSPHKLHDKLKIGFRMYLGKQEKSCLGH